MPARTKPQDQAIQALTWDYDFDKPPKLARRARQPPGRRAGRRQGACRKSTATTSIRPTPQPASPSCSRISTSAKTTAAPPAATGSTAAAFPTYDRNRARDRNITDNPRAAGMGATRGRSIGGSCTTAPRPTRQGKPWSERKKYIWWDAEQKKWTGLDVPDFEPTKDPAYRAADGRKRNGRHRRRQPLHHETRRRRLALRPRQKQGRPLPHALRAGRIARDQCALSKAERQPDARDISKARSTSSRTRPRRNIRSSPRTFRLTEHYLSGPMSRFNSWLNELQPEMFCRAQPRAGRRKRNRPRRLDGHPLAARHRSKPAPWSRGASSRCRCRAAIIHQIGLPFHWGFAGESVGCQANDLVSLIADPNVSIHEAKAFVCDVQAGAARRASRRPDQAGGAMGLTARPSPATPKSAQPEGHMKS